MATMQRWTQAVLLGLTGLYFAYTVASGHIRNYIAPRYMWLTWLAAGILLLLAVVRALELGRGAGDHGHAHSGCDPVCDHDHGGGRIGGWVGIGIVALPVVLGVLVPSQPLDSRAIEGSISGSLGSIQAALGNVIDIAPQERNVLDWLRAFNTADDLAQLSGQEAELVGFVYRDARFERATQFMIARFVISCCVADAQAIGIVVESPQAGSLSEDTWVRVRGTFEVKEFDGVRSPVLVAFPGEDGLTPSDPPDHPYLYP